MRLRIFAALLAIPLFMVCALAQNFELAKPEGPYAIGFWETTLKSDRINKPTDGVPSVRELLIQTWYPTEEKGKTKPFAPPEVAVSLASQFGLPKDFADSVATHSLVGAKIKAGDYPLVIFSHGLSWPGVLYQSLAEDLASRGYIVAVVNHPHGAAARYPDGRFLEFAPLPEFKEPKQREESLARLAAVWADDLKDVISACSSWTKTNSANPVAGHIQMLRIAVIGHSLGGTAAAQVLDDRRVTAAIAFEGKARTLDGNPQIISKPLLHLIGGYNRLELEGNQYTLNGGVLYEVIVGGTGHAYFSDLIFIHKHFADSKWLLRHRYEVEPARIIQISRDYVAAFLDWAFQGKNSSLLRPVSYYSRVDGPQASGYPEVDLHITIK